VTQHKLDLELDPHKWPLTLMWVSGKEKEVNFTSMMMKHGVIPWHIDVHTRLEQTIGLSIPFVRRVSTARPQRFRAGHK
jgi:hypothetical protein